MALICSFLAFLVPLPGLKKSPRLVMSGMCMPTSACENDGVAQKVVDQVVKSREEGAAFRYQIGYYMGLQQKHTALAMFYNSGKISESESLRGFGFYGLKGSCALIMPHLKLPCHTLAQFRLVRSFHRRDEPHACIRTPRRRR